VPVGHGAHNHHGSADDDRETGPYECIQTGPLQVGEPQPFVRDAALLKEQLPWRDGSTDDSNHQEYEAHRKSPSENARDERIAKGFSLGTRAEMLGVDQR
jgi:hypothetical protein